MADDDGRFDWAVPDEEVHAFINDLERRPHASDGDLHLMRGARESLRPEPLAKFGSPSRRGASNTRDSTISRSAAQHASALIVSILLILAVGVTDELA